MHYRYVFTEWFERNLRYLHRHNPHLRRDLKAFLGALDADAHPVISGTGGARKARMKVSGRGKSGGYRVIYYVFLEHKRRASPARHETDERRANHVGKCRHCHPYRLNPGPVLPLQWPQSQQSRPTDQDCYTKR